MDNINKIEQIKDILDNYTHDLCYSDGVLDDILIYVSKKVYESRRYDIYKRDEE